MAVKLPNVWQVKGKTYFRRKVSGQHIYTPLPDPSDPQFAIEYQKAKTGAELLVIAEKRGSNAPARGTFKALIEEYRGSADYRALKPSSKRLCEIYMRLFENRFGDRMVKDMTPAAVDRIRDDYIDTPAKANGVISWLRILLNVGIRRGYCATNPTVGVKMMKTGEHQPWPEDVIVKAIEGADPMLRIAIITGLCSGQRVSDCVTMRRDQFDSFGRMPLQQIKTGKHVLIPQHPLWKEAIEQAPPGEWIITGPRGAQQKAKSLSAKVTALLKELGVTGYTFHGLRKNATNFLTECGLTPVEVGVITGMSIEMVQHYTRGIQQARILDLVEERIKRAAPVVSLHTRGGNSAAAGR